MLHLDLGTAKNILFTGEGIPAGARPVFRRHRHAAGPEGGAIQPGTPGVPRRHPLYTLRHLQTTGLWRVFLVSRPRTRL